MLTSRIHVIVAPLVLVLALQTSGCAKKPVPPPPAGGVYTSQSAGASFDQSVNIEGKEGEYIARYDLFDIDRAGFNSDIVLIAAGSRGLVVSQNNGQTWTNVPTPLTQALDVVVLDNKTIVVSGTDAKGQGHIVRSLDEGKSWQSVFTIPLPAQKPGQLQILGNTGLPSSVIVTLTRDPFNGDRLYAGTNLGSVLAGEQSAKVWRTIHRIKTGDLNPVENPQETGITALVASPATRNEVMVITQDRRLIRVRGDSEEIVKVPLSLGETGPLQLSQNRKVHNVSYVQGFPDALIVGGDRGVLATRDRGKTWIDLKIPVDPVQQFATIVAVVSPTNTNRILVAIDDVVYRSEDGGQTWNTFSLGLPEFAIRYLSINPKNAGQVLAVTTGKKL